MKTELTNLHFALDEIRADFGDRHFVMRVADSENHFSVARALHALAELISKDPALYNIYNANNTTAQSQPTTTSAEKVWYDE